MVVIKTNTPKTKTEKKLSSAKKADAKKPRPGIDTPSASDKVVGHELVPKDLTDLPLTDPRNPLHVSAEEAKRRAALPKPAPTVPTNSAFVAAPKAAKAGRVGKHGDTDVITLVADKNPRREGTKAAGRFAHYKSGMTVGAFVKACAEIGGRLDKKLARRARRAVMKDAAKGHITVAKAK